MGTEFDDDFTASQSGDVDVPLSARTAGCIMLAALLSGCYDLHRVEPVDLVPNDDRLRHPISIQRRREDRRDLDR